MKPGSGDGPTVRTISNVLVLTSSYRYFAMYRDQCKEDSKCWFRAAKFIFVQEIEDTYGLSPDDTILRYIIGWWDCPVVNHRRLRMFPAPFGRYRRT